MILRIITLRVFSLFFIINNAIWSFTIAPHHMISHVINNEHNIIKHEVE